MIDPVRNVKREVYILNISLLMSKCIRTIFIKKEFDNYIMQTIIFVVTKEDR